MRCWLFGHKFYKRYWWSKQYRGVIVRWFECLRCGAHDLHQYDGRADG